MYSIFLINYKKSLSFLLLFIYIKIIIIPIKFIKIFLREVSFNLYHVKIILKFLFDYFNITHKLITIKIFSLLKNF